MPRWLALLMGVALVAVAGTAMALSGSSETAETEAATETTIKFEEEPEVEATTTTTHQEIEEEEIQKETLEIADLPKSEPIDEDSLDDTPPLVEILHPHDGQVYEQSEAVFEGITEPGARVFAGGYEADVNEEGAWRIVLRLAKGENTVTVKAFDGHENFATDAVTVVYEAPKPEPKEEPKEEPHEWEFSALQLYGECAEDPPYDVFHGTGTPGTVIHVESEFGGGETKVGEKGGWEIKVIFKESPIGEAFPVWVSDQFGNTKVFEFIHTG